jgi:hypothetical protein
MKGKNKKIVRKNFKLVLEKLIRTSNLMDGKILISYQ